MVCLSFPGWNSSPRHRQPVRRGNMLDKTMKTKNNRWRRGIKSLLACSKPVCMRLKSRSLHSQAFRCLSWSDPSRSLGPSLRTWACSSDTRCLASCTKVAKCTARPSRLTTETDRERNRWMNSHRTHPKLFFIHSKVSKFYKTYGAPACYCLYPGNFIHAHNTGRQKDDSFTCIYLKLTPLSFWIVSLILFQVY